MQAKLRAYSLGYQGMTIDAYVSVLKSNGVNVVVDVRETPWSYKRGFSKKPLSERLLAEGIFYIHLKSAGNPSKNRKLGLQSHEVIDLYRQHLEENLQCLSEIQILLEQSSEQSVCLLCFEQRPHECHRTVILDKMAELDERIITCHLDWRAAA